MDGTQLNCDDFLQNYNILVDVIDWLDIIVVITVICGVFLTVVSYVIEFIIILCSQ